MRKKRKVKMMEERLKVSDKRFKDVQKIYLQNSIPMIIKECEIMLITLSRHMRKE